jgi:hypothetical protein
MILKLTFTTINKKYMANLFIKYPSDAKQETIVNLQSIKFIEKSNSVSFEGEIENFRILFIISNEDYFYYETENQKTRDDFFDAILQKLSLNN